MEFYQIHVVHPLGLHWAVYCHQLFFIICTNECQSYEDNYYVVKYAHNTVFLSLLSNSKHDDNHAILKFITWCNKA